MRAHQRLVEFAVAKLVGRREGWRRLANFKPNLAPCGALGKRLFLRSTQGNGACHQQCNDSGTLHLYPVRASKVGVAQLRKIPLRLLAILLASKCHGGPPVLHLSSFGAIPDKEPNT